MNFPPLRHSYRKVGCVFPVVVVYPSGNRAKLPSEKMHRTYNCIRTILIIYGLNKIKRYSKRYIRGIDIKRKRFYEKLLRYNARRLLLENTFWCCILLELKKCNLENAIKWNHRIIRSVFTSIFSKIHCPYCRRGHEYGQEDSFDRQDDMEVVKIGVGGYPLVERNHNRPMIGSK